MLSAAPQENAAFSNVDESGSAGTGETGGPNSVQESKKESEGGEKSKRDSRIEQKTVQQALKNKFG